MPQPGKQSDGNGVKRVARHCRLEAKVFRELLYALSAAQSTGKYLANSKPLAILAQRGKPRLKLFQRLSAHYPRRSLGNRQRRRLGARICVRQPCGSPNETPPPGFVMGERGANDGASHCRPVPCRIDTAPFRRKTKPQSHTCPRGRHPHTSGQSEKPPAKFPARHRLNISTFPSARIKACAVIAACSVSSLIMPRRNTNLCLNSPGHRRAIRSADIPSAGKPIAFHPRRQTAGRGFVLGLSVELPFQSQKLKPRFLNCS